ncbi:MAG TPA: bifunctional phosphopantothenoylcysteine decarboxylase/phosphopantothenate--cysteine ligase CoaBC [Actinomycetota bacterium]|nr:bifunctional phosphopantothenoylcysteine decarboxylase/phosphopantothenate--cysteine ligase CoaBC [Actinomycetota bacterium]
MDLAGKHIVVGVCGGIAAYKAVEVARRLTQAGAEVRVVMTEAATRFVGPLTFSTLTGHPVASDLFGEPAPPEIVHTSLGRWADLVVVAPATADMIARYALGLAGDLLSALLLATRAPVVMAPAMHTEMWENEATSRNVATLRGRGVVFVGPATGDLAGPDQGPGRLAETNDILDAVAAVLARGGELAGRRVVVSAGGTREPIDPVRYIGNRSSGRMGYEVAAEALRRGAAVTLVTGPTHLSPPPAATVVQVETAAQMWDAVMAASGEADVVVMAAAVADWRPVETAARKLKKGEGPPPLVLEATRDILAGLAERRRNGQVLVGFAAETEDVEARALAKLAAKSVDLVVGNLVGVDDSGFDTDTNRAVLVGRDQRIDHLPLASKRELAGAILDAVTERFLR